MQPLPLLLILQGELLFQGTTFLHVRILSLVHALKSLQTKWQAMEII